MSLNAMQDENGLKLVNFIKKQFLCGVPIKNFAWTEISDLNLELQAQIITNTTRLKSVLQYPLNINYQKAFLKSLIEYLEIQESVIDDNLYVEYGRLVALPFENSNFKHYVIDEKSNKKVILKEDVHLISDGTTGLRTWQASLALSEWILRNTYQFKDKIILELGSGIGLTGLIIASNCAAKTVFLTDCHPSVLTTLCENIKININNNSEGNCDLVNERCLLEEHTDSGSVVRVLKLPWEEISFEICQELGHIDKIVAADVVYDKTIFNCLINAVDCLFKYCGVEEFILSCTERNSETLDDFLSLLKTSYVIDTVDVPPQENFMWSDVPPVKIFNIKPFC